MDGNGWPYLSDLRRFLRSGPSRSFRKADRQSDRQWVWQYRPDVDFVVCPNDHAAVKVIGSRWGPNAIPLTRCPECGRRFILDRDKGLIEVNDSALVRPPGFQSRPVLLAHAGASVKRPAGQGSDGPVAQVSDSAAPSSHVEQPLQHGRGTAQPVVLVFVGDPGPRVADLLDGL